MNGAIFSDKIKITRACKKRFHSVTINRNIHKTQPGRSPGAVSNTRKDTLMIHIVFVCHGNICRSPMAEFIMKHLLKKAGKDKDAAVSSYAATPDDLGSDMHPKAKQILLAKGVPFTRRKAQLFTKEIYDESDYIIAMDDENIRDLSRITGGDPDHKTSLLLSWEGKKGSVADPYFTGNFQKAYEDICGGCQAVMTKLFSQKDAL
jgi:protein-tyrosine phosphatase